MGHTVQLWDLSTIRRRLAELDLDWDLPAFPPSADTDNRRPLQVKVELGNLALTAEQKARRDIERYRRALEGNPEDAQVCNGLAWTHVTAPEALRDLKEMLTFAEKAVHLAPMNSHYRNTLGAAYYRAGRYKEAVQTLQPNLKYAEDRFLGFDLYFLAMSYQQLGDSARAREYYDLSVRWCQARPDLSPEHVAELSAFRAEAETLLALPASATPAPGRNSGRRPRRRRSRQRPPHRHRRHRP